MAVIGIDLGTSNTCVAVVMDGRPQVILDDKSRATMPSVMALTRQGKFTIGHMARAQLAITPESTIHSAKRLIGQKYDDPTVQATLPMLAYNVTKMENGMPGFVVGGNVLSPIEVSAAVLKKVKVIAEAAIGSEVNQAVISVPAHFDNVQRTSTKRAAEIAGLDVLRLINEPTAAALAYGYGGDETKVVAIYDFGGGTFDISVLEIGDGIYNVLATGGDTFLGGNDFNQAIAQWLFDRLKQRTGIDVSQDTLSRQRVLDAAEFAKIQLSSEESTHIELEDIAPNTGKRISVNEILTRSQMEQLCTVFVQRSLDICGSVFANAGISTDQLDEIVLVGGTSRMSIIRSMVEQYFGKTPNTAINPDEAVAIGAAIQAKALDNDENDILLLDVVPLTLGIEAAGGIFIPLITKNTKVPHRVSKIFTTNRENQESVIISIYQGESNYCSDNTLLSTFELSGIRPAHRMEPQIEVTLRIDVNGILSITAMDLDTHQSQSVQIVDMSVKIMNDLQKQFQ